MKELDDIAAQGRAYGNLGNTNYLLGNFYKAINYHEEVSNTAVFSNITLALKRFEYWTKTDGEPNIFWLHD